MKWVLLLLVLKLVACDVPLPKVTLPSGNVIGTFQEDVNGKQFNAFEGIPYAMPPVGDLRFRPPQPIRRWSGILEANSLHTCLQYTHLIEPGKDRVIGSEDCLYLDVYTPQLHPGALLDVIVFIHGGAFMFGTGHRSGPNIILSRDLVYVRFTYRLGPLGFMSTESNVVPGNMGLKDQAMALKWIKDNILHFGGNPNSITLTGLSAGGASVHLHYMSPLSAGLFNRGISMSGTALMPWVMVENSLEKAKSLATSIGCETTNVTEMVECMRYCPGKQLVQNVEQFFGYLYNPFSPFGVVVEPKPEWGEKPFLPQHPYEVLNTGNIQQLPWITSTTQAEGLYPASEFLSKPKYLPEIASRYYEIAPYLLDYNYTIIESKNNNKASVAHQCLREYFHNRPISRDTYDELVQMLGDRLYVVNSDMSARLHAQTSAEPVYYYYFSYRSNHSFSDQLSPNTENVGVSHGDDVAYILGSSKSRGTEMDIQMSDALINFWISYANTSVPKMLNKPWPTVSKNSSVPLRCINISSPTEVQETTMDDFGRSKFWLSLPFRENEKFYVVSSAVRLDFYERKQLYIVIFIIFLGFVLQIRQSLIA